MNSSVHFRLRSCNRHARRRRERTGFHSPSSSSLVCRLRAGNTSVPCIHEGRETGSCCSHVPLSPPPATRCLSLSGEAIISPSCNDLRLVSPNDKRDAVLHQRLLSSIFCCVALCVSVNACPSAGTVEQSMLALTICASSLHD